MVDPVMISFHEDSCREYLEYWRDAARREAAEMEESDAAYHVLEHAALLERYVPKGSNQVVRQIEDLPLDERVRLVRVASQFACQFSLSDYCNRLFRQEVLDVDDIAEVEMVLIQRDALDAVVDFAARLVNERIEHDDDLLADLALAHCAAAELDDTLLTRPDIIAPASRILEETCPLASAGLWLQKAREFDERFQEPTLAEFRRSVAVQSDYLDKTVKNRTTDFNLGENLSRRLQDWKLANFCRRPGLAHRARREMLTWSKETFPFDQTRHDYTEQIRKMPSSIQLQARVWIEQQTDPSDYSDEMELLLRS